MVQILNAKKYIYISNFTFIFESYYAIDSSGRFYKCAENDDTLEGLLTSSASRANSRFIET